ncbi:hypothetical protein D3C84_610930 [compost metagenome]
MGSNQTFLFCRWRCPIGCRMTHRKTFHRNIVYKWLFWIENRFTCIDFDQLFIWIYTDKLSVNCGILNIHFGEPKRITCIGCFYHFIFSGSFHQPFPIQIHTARVMLALFCNKPIATNQIIKRIKTSKHRIRYNRFPGIISNFRPVFYNFRSFNNYILSFCCLISNAFCI